MKQYPIGSVKIGVLRPDPENPMRHNDAHIQRLVGSIQTDGFIQPIAVSIPDMTIIAGHGRVEAARAAGFDEVPAVLIDDYDRTKRRLALINTNGTYGEFEDDDLRNLLRNLANDGVDLDLTGLEPYKLDFLMGDDVTTMAPPESFPAYSGEVETDYRCPKCSYEWSGKAK